MNTVPGDYRTLREGLARLPEFPVPDGLWPRILARRAAAAAIAISHARVAARHARK